MGLAITVHLGLDDVELVLGSAADDLHLILANLLDQRLLKGWFSTHILRRRLFLCTLSSLEIEIVPRGPLPPLSSE